MPSARASQIDLSVTPYYHCMTRCVRRAFLCGDDQYSGNNYDHRKEWVRSRLRYLSTVFSIDVCAYAVMSNHLHIVLFIDQPRAQAWSNEEVVARYTGLYPMLKSRFAEACPDRKELFVAEWRSRLSDISWMMRAINEFIARRANREDKVSGRFWEGRFKSQALVDRQGLLACMAYVDLNPVRAGLADSLDGSDFTSIQERLHDASMKSANQGECSAPASLAPLSNQESGGDSVQKLPVSFAEYIELLEWTGQAMLNQASILGESQEDVSVPSLLTEHKLCPSGWLEVQGDHRLGTASFLGSVTGLEEVAKSSDKRWVRGIGIARRMAS